MNTVVSAADFETDFVLYDADGFVDVFHRIAYEYLPSEERKKTELAPYCYGELFVEWPDDITPYRREYKRLESDFYEDG